MNTFMWRWCQSYSKEILIVLEILLLTGLVLCLGFGIVYIIKMVFARILIAHCGSKPSKSTLDDVAVEESSWLLTKIWSHIRGWFGYGKRATPPKPKPPTPPQEEGQPTPQEEVKPTPPPATEAEGPSTPPTPPPATKTPPPLTESERNELERELQQLQYTIRGVRLMLKKSKVNYMNAFYNSRRSDSKKTEEELIESERDLNNLVEGFSFLRSRRDELRRLLSLKPITVYDEAILCPETFSEFLNDELDEDLVNNLLEIEFKRIEKKCGIPYNNNAYELLTNWYNENRALPISFRYHAMGMVLKGIERDSKNPIDDVFVASQLAEIEYKYKYSYWGDLTPKLEEIMGKEKSDALKIKLYKDPSLYELKRPFNLEDNMDVAEAEEE